MIRKLCDAHQLPRESELRAFVGGDSGGQVALCVGMIDGKPYAIDNACPHARAALAGGHLVDAIVVCPLHGWQWDMVTGDPVRHGDPSVQTYEIRQYGTEVFVRIPAGRQTSRIDQVIR